ncbi:hypothetical protein MMC13_006422 [Lambiella insularis]|nr:hypothetical protein [Lambiella insularis]
MPTRLAAPVLTVDANKMHKIDTRNVENLFGMWQVFSRCAESMEEGRRLENLSWRIWNRETFCCESQPQLTTTPAIDLQRSRPNSKDIPELSASVDSVASVDAERLDSLRSSTVLPLDILHTSPASSVGSLASSRGREKHITSLGLEKMVQSIKEKKEIEPLSPSITDAVPMSLPMIDTTPRSASPALRNSSRQSSDSSTSTCPLSDSGSPNNTTRGNAFDTSADVLMSHSVVRGFSPSQISSSFRSHTHLAPAPIPTKSSTHPKNEELKRQGGMGFMLGGSSGEDESSLDEKMGTQQPRQSSLTSGLKPQAAEKKQTSFKDEVESRTISHRSHEDEDVFESDDEEDVSESAIEDEEDESDWEDSATDSGASSVNDKQLFQRVDSRPHLPSRRSLLTSLMHQPDRAAALAQQALENSKSMPALHRSRTSSPNGPSVAASPEDESTLAAQKGKIPGAKPIIMTTSNTHPPALSPRATRRNMLATELTESLRKHLLWERQQKNTTQLAILKRRHTAQDMANLQKFPDPARSDNSSRNNSWNNHHFEHGLGEYHQKGW